MRKFSDRIDFQVTWRPYQLSPDAPGGKGINKLAMYNEKFGEARVKQMLPYMQQVGQQDGINFSYGGNVGNTFDSHRLISLAQKQGKQDELVEELFHNYFEQEKCVSDHAVLLAAAEKVGVSGAAQMLQSSAEVNDVQADLRQFVPYARSGVPQFIIDGRPLPAGAQDAELLEQRFAELLR
mmetsp:Transcript_31134/g.88942  ORF Transcript_31134/g.88942 Transcript_31134/m.88942 type:complete len:181 (-) Transcript_31134:130-672(-)|eukprot:CAMPEP_0176258722 /NCGR_PEP_ID=MMETSP0121_2-20121125/38707_1 /TAXON_ID=160619 /ORGANISM="Kryptoperidinium foliaceum, Strain CCMP 1326" /LENGTH=180 /DNA_ID=CAMNT_0017598597 /DNA_START=67 /DNA_END=609 /DNA_ORIENTATION=+